MADQLSLRELASRSIERAIPARKFVKIVQDWNARQDIPHDITDDLTALLLDQLIAAPFSQAHILGYLTQSIQTQVLSAHNLLVHLLFLISDNQPISTNLLVSICTIVLSNLPESYTLASVLDRPAVLMSVPDVGTSASASPPPSSTSTLALLLPLLRQCSSTPPASSPVILLVSRLLHALQPYPAPPLDVGLEAGGLFQSLPESLSVPLRDCLSGLMADLAVLQDPTQVSSLPTVPAPSAPLVVNPIVPTSAGGETKIPTPSLPPLRTQVSIPHILAFELSLLLKSDRWTVVDVSTPGRPPENHIALITLGKGLCPEPGDYLAYLVQASLKASAESVISERVDRWLWVTERLPALLKWWRDTPQSGWMYPDSLRTALSHGFDKEKEGLAACDAWISSTLAKLVDQAEHDDDSGGFTQPEGWMMCSQQVTCIQRFLDLGLLQKTDASAMLPGMSFPSNDPGESLMSRVASASKTHLSALSHIVAYAPGAARSLAKDVYETVQACPQTPPMDGLFVNLAQEPNFLAALGSCITPASWLRSIRNQLLEHPEDTVSRDEDPQGSSQRFGEGIVLAEVFVAHFKLPLPPLLQEARMAHDFSSLEAPRKACVSGWVRALYGSQGIDDEIILSTSPADFYRLTASIISQTVLATARGVLDMETLQSGLSYFAQPLLSWSLAGAVDWLANEVLRNGLISGPHLVVLQALVLSSSFPDSILRVTRKRIADILEPSASLGPVFQTANFDAEGMRQKLATLELSSNTFSAPMDDLRQQVQTLKTMDLAPTNWPNALLDSLERAISWLGQTSVARLVINEILTGPTVALPADGYTALVSWIISRRTCIAKTPLYSQAVPVVLPDLLSDTLSPLSVPATRNEAVATLARSFKYILMALSTTDKRAADHLAEELLDELAYQRERPVKIETPSGDKDAEKADAIEPEIKAVLEAITAALAGDDEIKSQWQTFESLEP